MKKDKKFHQRKKLWNYLHQYQKFNNKHKNNQNNNNNLLVNQFNNHNNNQYNNLIHFNKMQLITHLQCQFQCNHNNQHIIKEVVIDILVALSDFYI